MFQNFALITAEKSGLDFYSNTEQSQLLRSELLKNGLSFTSVRVNGQLHFMIVSNDLQLIKKLAKDFKCGKFYLSDSQRTLFEVSIVDNFKPTKLGQLKRLTQPSGRSGANTSGAFCLVVTEDGQTYHYGVEQNVEDSPQLPEPNGELKVQP
jgi:hypothetical protein